MMPIRYVAIASLGAITAAPIVVVLLVATRQRITTPMRNVGLTTLSSSRHFASGAAVIGNKLFFTSSNLTYFSYSMDSENPKLPGQQPELEEQETIANYFGLKEPNLKESSSVLLQEARELFDTESTELTLERSVVIGEETLFLQYTIFPRESGQVWVRVGLFKDQPPQSIQNATALNEGEVAMTRLMFNFEKGSVHGEASTDEHFEGRGFGSAMVFMREGIIHDILRRYSDRVTPSGLTSEITDNSRSSREGVEYEN